MPLSIVERPQKTIGSFVSKWNAAGGNLPVEYEFYQTFFPVAQIGTSYSAVSDSVNELANFTVLNTSVLSVGQFIYIASGNYAGVSRITEIVSSTNFRINRPFVANESGTFKNYYNNYKANIEVYTDGSLITTISVNPEAFNFRVDISEAVKKDLVENQVNEFYIKYYETYELVRGTTTTGTVNDDSANTFFATYSSLPYKYQYAGNMFEYVVGNSTEAKWMTEFERPVYFSVNSAWSISILSDTGTFDVTFDQYDRNGVLLSSDTVNYSGSPGLFAIDFSNITIDPEADYIEMYDTEIELIRVDIDGTTRN